MIAVNRREVLRYLGNAAPEEGLLRAVESVVSSLEREARPRGVLRRVPVTVQRGGVWAEGRFFDSARLAQNLRRCREAYFVAATLGPQADRQLKRYALVDPARAVVFQAACTALLEAYLDSLEEEMRASAPGLFLRPRFSPGYGDLSLEAQEAMFSLLDLKRLGFCLTQARMMLPEKSVTAIVGLSDAPEAHAGGCAACAKADCQNRRMCDESLS